MKRGDPMCFGKANASGGPDGRTHVVHIYHTFAGGCSWISPLQMSDNGNHCQMRIEAREKTRIPQQFPGLNARVVHMHL